MPLAHQASKTFSKSLAPTSKVVYTGDLVNSANTIRAIYTTTTHDLIRIGKILNHTQTLFSKYDHPNKDFKNWVTTEFSSYFSYSSALNFMRLSNLLDKHTDFKSKSTPLGSLYLLGRETTDPRIVNLVSKCNEVVKANTISKLISVQHKLDSASETLQNWIEKKDVISVNDLAVLPALLSLDNESQMKVLGNVSESRHLSTVSDMIPVNAGLQYQIERLALRYLKDIVPQSHEVGICYLPIEYEEKNEDISLSTLLDCLTSITSQMLYIITPTEDLSEVMLYLGSKENIEYYWAFNVKRPTLFNSERNIASQSLLVLAYKVKGSFFTPEYIQDSHPTLAKFLETVITQWYNPKNTLFVSFTPKPSERIVSLPKLKTLFTNSRLTLAI